MVTQTEQGSLFRIRCQRMDELHILLQGEQGASHRVNLNQIEPDLWHAVVPLAPGEYRCRFYGKVGPTLIFLGPQDNTLPLSDGWNQFTVPAATKPTRGDRAGGQGHRDATRISTATSAAPFTAALTPSCQPAPAPDLYLG